MTQRTPHNGLERSFLWLVILPFPCSLTLSQYCRRREKKMVNVYQIISVSSSLMVAPRVNGDDFLTPSPSTPRRTWKI